MKKVMVVWVILSFLVSIVMVGCGERKSEEEQIGELFEKLSQAKTEKEEQRILERIEKLTEKQEKEEKKSLKYFSGRYVSQKTSGFYLELKNDGTFLIVKPDVNILTWKKGLNKTEGRWKITRESSINFTGSGVIPFTGEIKGDIIALEFLFGDIETLVKKGKEREITKKKITPRPSRKISEDGIVGKYIMRDVRGRLEKEPGIMNFRKDGTITVTVLGTWKTEGDRIKFYEGDKEIESQQMSDDNTIRGSQGEYLTKKEGAKIIRTFEVEVPISSGVQPVQPASQLVPDPISDPISKRIKDRRVQPRQRQRVPDRVQRYGREIETPKGEIPATELRKIVLWSDYVSEDGQDSLKLREDGTFLEKIFIGKWRIKDGFVEIVGKGNVYKGRIGEDNSIIVESIIVETEDGRIKIVKQD